MRKLIFPLLLLALTCIGWGPMMLSTKPSSSLTCTLYDSWTTGESSQYSVARYNAKEWVGTMYTPPVQITVCQIDWWISGYGGTPANRDYYTSFYLLDGSLEFTYDSDLVTNGRSAKVDGSAWNNEWVTWTFSSYPVLAASTNYGLIIHVVDDGEDPSTQESYEDGTDYVDLGYDDENDSTDYIGGRRHWDSIEQATDHDPEDDILVKVYTMQ